MTNERLHDLDTVLTYEEIEELRNICYENGNSWCPISDFFNDIERNTNKNYNKNQAFKDLWLIVNIILEKQKKHQALEFIKKCPFDLLEWTKNYDNVNETNYYELLKEVLYVKEENRT